MKRWGWTFTFSVDLLFAHAQRDTLVNSKGRFLATTPSPYKNVDGYLQLSRSHSSICLRHKVLHNHCFQFLLRLTIALEKLERKRKLNLLGRTNCIMESRTRFFETPAYSNQT